MLKIVVIGLGSVTATLLEKKIPQGKIELTATFRKGFQEMIPVISHTQNNPTQFSFDYSEDRRMFKREHLLT